MNEFDDSVLNPCDNPSLEQLRDPFRREFLRASALAALFAAAPGFAHAASSAKTPLFGFKSVPMSAASDTVVVPQGYTWHVLAAWGDPIDGAGPSIRSDVADSAEDQGRQFGMHHDGCHYFPIRGSSRHGLWVQNHEYTDDGLLHPGGMSPWTAEKVKKSQAAHGVSVCEIRMVVPGRWRVVRSKYARRITATTPIEITGPAAGHALMRTAADPAGRTVLGTINNCAHGVTPWGTYLTCEENFNGYFVNASGNPTADQKRLGIDAKGFGYRWHEHDERFDAAKHPHEPHRFGWVVEIDPWDPAATPKKRTALGRIKREGAWVTLATDRRVVVYSGDDQRGEYVYKFVSRRPFDPKNPKAARDLLDEGTLYVARFDAHGTGEWLPLVHGARGLDAAAGFPDQASVLIHTRLAADRLGATRMDRPEWIAVHPATGEVYVTLTNNSDRGKRYPPDGPNPRAGNAFGHVLRWRESAGDAASEVFRWEVFALAGDPQAKSAEHRGDIKGDFFGSPDGLWFDRRGILWVQTDISTSALGRGAYANIPNNMMLACDPGSGEFRRFLIGPRGCEVTGVVMTPDLRTMFVNIQHPGESPSERSDPANPKAVSSWPDGERFTRPRSATVVIRRRDGGLIGS
jgi:secreted PhoX family phosphatase